MQSPEYPDYDPLSGFEAFSKAAPLLESFVEYGPDRLAVVSDWDGVLTEKDPDGILGTTWGVMTQLMTDENRAQHRELYNYFHTLELDGNLSPPTARIWQEQALQLMAGVPLDNLRANAFLNVNLRPGTLELFKTCEDLGVPIIVKSTGSSEIIETVLGVNGLQAHVFSNRFLTDEAGIITGFDPDCLTHSLNKNSWSHRSLPGLEDRDAAIVLGDNPHDAKMTRYKDSTSSLMIRIDGGRDYYIETYDEDVWEEYKWDSYRHGFHAVAINPDMLAVNGLVHTISGANKIAEPPLQ
jgi:phosphoserine phosphatase